MPLEGGTQERQKTHEFPYNIKRKKKTPSTNKKWKKQPFMGKLRPLSRGRFQSLFRRQLLMMQQAAVSQGET